MAAPEILLGGHHAKIRAWQRQQAIIKTARVRPDLLKTAELTKEEAEFLQNFLQNSKEE